MLSIFISSVVFSVVVSALCSLMEAVLYSVPLAHVKHEADSGKKSAKILLELKSDVARPIAAILILNTIANTAGAAIAGAYAGKLWGEEGVLIFSICFTLMILYFSEIVPKQLGVRNAKVLSTLIPFPLLFLIKAFSPLIFISKLVSGLFSSKDFGPSVSQEEVLSIAALGAEEGVLDELEGSVIKNVVGLDSVLIKDILTPRVVVFRLEASRKIGEVEKEIENLSYSRIPLFLKDSPEQLSTYVTQRDILRELIRGNKEKFLSEIARPLTVVPETLRVDQLLLQMISAGEHFFAVVNEHGGFSGVVTMEDVIETMLGQEIVDEYDRVTDLRYYAKVVFSKKKKNLGKDIGK